MTRKNPWLYYGRKLLALALSVFVLSAVVFYIARLAPGDPLVSYSVDIAAGKNYTSYLIGSSWSDLNFRVLTVEN